MKIAVITPYYKEPTRILEECHKSVLLQSHECRHILVADGHANPVIDQWNADHLKLPHPHHDIGSTPRLIGAIHAIGSGCDGIFFLDADNWFEPNHVEMMAHLHRETNAIFTTAERKLFTTDGDYMGICPNTHPERFIDTNCMAFWPGGFDLLMHWVTMPDYAHIIGDRVMLYHVKKSGRCMAHLEHATVCYRCSKPGLYAQLNWPSRPPDINPQPDYDAAFQQWEESGLDPLR